MHQVAHSLGFGEGYRMLPFKGLYLYCNVPLTRLLYPVPDLETNVLGVHYTVTVDGKVKIGPTATPGFWRENYVRLLAWCVPHAWGCCLVVSSSTACVPASACPVVVTEWFRQLQPGGTR